MLWQEVQDRDGNPWTPAQWMEQETGDDRVGLMTGFSFDFCFLLLFQDVEGGVQLGALEPAFLEDPLLIGVIVMLGELLSLSGIPAEAAWNDLGVAALDDFFKRGELLVKCFVVTEEDDSAVEEEATSISPLLPISPISEFFSFILLNSFSLIPPGDAPAEDDFGVAVFGAFFSGGGSGGFGKISITSFSPLTFS